MRKSKLVEKALKECGAEFIRRNRHKIYRLPNGKIFTLSTTSSDRNAEKVQLSLLKKLLI